jgi:hypothetical protein
MAIRVPRRHLETPRTDRRRHHRHSGAELFGYLGMVAFCIAVAWALATVG